MKLQSSSSNHMNDNNPSTPGKFKMDKSFHNRFRFFHYSSLAKLTFWSFIFLALILVFFFKSPTSSSSYPLSPSMMTSSKPSMTSSLAASDLYRASGFVGTHVSVALKRRGDGVLGLDNFNDYYEPSLKRARQALLERSGIYVVEGDINDVALLKKLFELDILKGKPIPIFEGANHGTVARDFTYIDDIVKGCLGALDTAEKSTGSGGKKRGPAQLRVFNLGNTSPVPVSDLVSILERLLKVKAKRMVMKLPRNGDVQFTHANISLAKREFGYKPTTDLQTGLKKFVRWYVSYYGSSKKSDQ
nr:UDP-glucuronate 4-epimerase 3-like [Tanacetum cinerariifolium]